MNGVIPGRSPLVPFQDDGQEESSFVGLKLFRSDRVGTEPPLIGGEPVSYDAAHRTHGQHSGQVSSGPFLVVPQPKGRQIRLEPGLAMAQHETGLNEAGTAEILTGGASSYAYPSTDFCLYGETDRWSRPSTQRQHQVLAPATLFRYRVVKRAGELVLTAVAMPILLPILFVLAILVRVTSPGPIFFSHRRICKNGAFFSMWKFRTMCVNSSEVLERYLAAHPEARSEWNQTHKLQNDPRVTRIGRVMRRLSLDELPQIWNVITGRMSLVGPRPIVAAEVEKYAECFHCYTQVKPGVTGLWQVSGRSKLSYQERVKLDCEYVARWSLLRDLKILALTVRSVVNQEGAY